MAQEGAKGARRRVGERIKPRVSRAWMTGSARSRPCAGWLGWDRRAPAVVSPLGSHDAVNARFTEQERAEIEVAAAAIGMTATGFAAEAALLAVRARR